MSCGLTSSLSMTDKAAAPGSVLQMRTPRSPEEPELAHGFLASQGSGWDSHPGLKTGLFPQLCLYIGDSESSSSGFEHEVSGSSPWS